MPEEYKGKISKKTEYTRTPPREWTEKELQWVTSLKEQGYSAKEIAESVDRTLTSVSIKLKRLGKKNNTYNADHVLEKYEVNNIFLKDLRPKSILDCYCGEKDFYYEYGSVANDIDENIEATYHMDAYKLLCKLYAENNKFDLIDLDPYGSAYDCFDLAIKMAKKGLVITFGELGHKRFRRLDFVSRYYGITSFDDFTLDTLIQHVQMIGRRNKKHLIVAHKREWKNIGRVWFLIEPLKITEQWEGKIDAY